MHQHGWLVIALYFLGQFIFTAVRANLSMKSTVTPWSNLRDYWKWHWPALAMRYALSLALFLIWWDNQEFWTLVFKRFSVDIGQGLPLTNGTALLYGLVSDPLLDWLMLMIPGLRSLLPKLNGKEEANDATAGK